MVNVKYSSAVLSLDCIFPNLIWVFIVLPEGAKSSFSWKKRRGENTHEPRSLQFNYTLEIKCEFRLILWACMKIQGVAETNNFGVRSGMGG